MCTQKGSKDPYQREQKLVGTVHALSGNVASTINSAFGLSGLRVLHGTKCLLLTALFSLSLSPLGLLFSQKGLS